MSNTKAKEVTSLLDTGDIGLTSAYASVNRNSTIHKSFDLSNVNIDGPSGKTFRQFHQTRLYIEQFDHMYSHNSLVKANTFLLSANLPDTIGYSIGSRWENPFGGFGNAMTNVLMQMGSSFLNKFDSTQGIGENIKSGINRATTFKVWGGTDNLSLTLKIPVVDDRTQQSSTAINLTEALEFLGCLVLPRKSGNLGFYQPPPSPMNLTIQYKSDKNLTLSPTYARVLLQLGGMLIVDKCVINKVSINYPNTKTMVRQQTGSSYYLSPLLAELTIEISTIEAMTAGTFGKMLWLQSQPNEATGNVDLSFIGDTVDKVKQWWYKGDQTTAQDKPTGEKNG
jgi:hypothetical protein